MLAVLRHFDAGSCSSNISKCFYLFVICLFFFMLNELMRLLADLLTSEIMGTPMWAMLEMMSLSSGGMLAC